MYDSTPNNGNNRLVLFKITPDMKPLVASGINIFYLSTVHVKWDNILLIGVCVQCGAEELM